MRFFFPINRSGPGPIPDGETVAGRPRIVRLESPAQGKTPLTTAETANLESAQMTPDRVAPEADAAVPQVLPPARPRGRSLFQRIEAFVSRLSTRNNFWHKVCSLIWLPYAFRSGISMKRLESRRFT